MKLLSQRLQGGIWGVVIFLLLLVAQALVDDPDPQPHEYSLDICNTIMPKDEGEVVLLRLEKNGEGGLTLHYEPHQVLGYGMAEIPRGLD